MEPNTILAPSVLVPVAVVLVVFLGIGIGIFKVMQGKKSARQRRDWVHAAYSIWTGGEDCATWTTERAQKSLASWYGAKAAGTYWEVIADLRRGQTGNVAWDRIRALDLLRIGCAARFVDDEQCWTEAGRIGIELQARYRSWDELARDFEAGMLGWQRSNGVSNPQETGRVQRNLPKLRQQIWPSIRYDAALGSDD